MSSALNLFVFIRETDILRKAQMTENMINFELFFYSFWNSALALLLCQKTSIFSFSFSEGIYVTVSNGLIMTGIVQPKQKWEEDDGLKKSGVENSPQLMGSTRLRDPVI